MTMEQLTGITADADDQTVSDAGPQDGPRVAAVNAVTIPGASGQRIIAGPDTVVTLPPGTELGAITVAGRDLIVPLPDGGRLVIVDGAVFVPELVIGQVEVPPATLVALLIGNEPQPAAGIPQSSGGNFAVAVGSLGDGYARGDLLPPTALVFTPLTQEELDPAIPDDEDAEPDLDPGVIIITPQTPAGSINAVAGVSEAGLPARGGESPGSNAAANVESTTGTIQFTPGNAPATVAVNGTVITAVGQTVATPLGTIVVTAIRVDAIDYTYTLTDNGTGDTVTDVVTVVVTDADGGTATGTLTVNIADDVPTAANDAATQGTENAPVVINAFANDVFGADGVDIDNSPTVRVTFGQGANGGAVSYDPATGLFTYTPTAGQTGSDSFTYTIVDGDGDSSTATVTVTLTADSAPVLTLTGGANVFEAGLPAGSNAAANSETATGTIAVATGGDTLASLVINGVNVTAGGTVTGASGTLTVTLANGVYGYSYTLTTPTAGDTTTDPFAVVATDSDGDTAQTVLTVTIVDDVPTAVNDSATQGTENAPVVINAFANDVFGADGVDIDNSPTVRVTFGQGANGGAVSYDPATGLFTYTPTAGQTGSDSFTYTIVDGDGDSSTATVTVTLTADSAPVLTLTGGANVFEAGLPAGSNAAADSETATGTIAVATGGDTLASLVINGVNVTAGGTVTGASGTLTVTLANGVYGYSYTLTSATTGDATSDPFTVVATDSDGDTAQTVLTVTIVDDMPTATNDVDRVSFGTGAAAAVVTVAVNLDSADLYAGLPAGATSLALNGATLTAVNGSLGYFQGASVTSASDAQAGGSFTREIDAFNDAPEALRVDFATGQTGVALTLGRLYQEAQALPTPEAERVIVTVGLADGTTQTLTVLATETNGVGERIVQLSSADFGGQLILSVQLAPDLSPPTFPDNFTQAQRDAFGTEPFSEFVLRGITYDVPTAAVSATFADGNVFTGVGGTDANASDGVVDIRGADGAAVAGVAAGTVADTAGGLGTPVAGLYGSLMLAADGSYRYTPTADSAELRGLVPGETRSDVFSYTIVDGDGDRSTATLTINIDGSDDPVAIGGLNPFLTGGDLVFDEADLAGGTSPTANALTQTGSFTVSAPDGYGTIVIGGQTVLSGGTFTPAVIDTPLGELTVTGFDAVTGQVSYQYVLSAAADHGRTGVENSRLEDAFDVVATDRNGTSSSATLSISIIDDVPVVNADTDRVFVGSAGSTQTENVVVDFTDANFWTGVPAGSTQIGLDGLTVASINGSLSFFRGASVLSATDAQSGRAFLREIDSYNDMPEGLQLTFAETQDNVRVTLGQLYVERTYRPEAEAEKVTVSVQLDDGSVVVRTVAATATTQPGALEVTLSAADFGGRLIQAIALMPDPSTPRLADNASAAVRAQANANLPFSEFVLRGVEYDVTTTTPPTRSTADGNVLTGVGGGDANATDGVADLLGADGGQVTNIGTGYSSAGGTVGVPLAGTFGTLTIDAGGNYSYELDNSLSRVANLTQGRTLIDRFSYTVTDGDGDRVTTTLTISIQQPPTGARVASASIVSEQQEATAPAVALVERGSERAAEASATTTFSTALVAAAVVATATPIAAETPHAAAGASSVEPAAAVTTIDAAHAAPTATSIDDAIPASAPAQATAADHGTDLSSTGSAQIVSDTDGASGDHAPVASDVDHGVTAMPDITSTAPAAPAAMTFLDASAIPVVPVAESSDAPVPAADAPSVAIVLADVLHGGTPVDAPVLAQLIEALPVHGDTGGSADPTPLLFTADAGDTGGHDLAAAWASMALATHGYDAAAAHDGVIAVAQA